MKYALKFQVILLGLMFITIAAKAQDPIKVAPGQYQKVLLDNAHVRVMEAVIKPGEEVPWHSHPNHIAYILSGGKLEFTAKGKSPETVELAAGKAMYFDAVTHMAKNIGDTEVKVIVIELKDQKKK
ncbi:cupin domain-containing protein [Solitalea lacus]|uniref:cupin domain-containing protein n=1 Tax=Solitalea lacus TaxID=2911172 RepID=UPI001EDB8AE9|nr:cupin domain-containing protein [Solitalea lacus]UKJ06659.1 cupin domain-containing protein [Solitalea lacus]